MTDKDLEQSMHETRTEGFTLEKTELPRRWEVRHKNFDIKRFDNRGDSHIKRGGMLVVSLRGVNFGFWFHLGCSGQNATTCSREGRL